MERWLFTPRKRNVGTLSATKRMRDFICSRLLLARLGPDKMPDYEEIVEHIDEGACILYVVGDPSKDLTVRTSVPAQYYDKECKEKREDDGKRKRLRMPVDRFIYGIHYGYLDARTQYTKCCADGFCVPEECLVGPGEALVCINPRHIIVQDGRHRPPAAIYKKNRCGEKSSAQSQWRWEGGSGSLITHVRGKTFTKDQNHVDRHIHTVEFGGDCDMTTKLNTAYNRKRTREEQEGGVEVEVPRSGRRIRFSEHVTILAPKAKRQRV